MLINTLIMSIELDLLYSEYHSLLSQYNTVKIRLESIVNVIKAYGGEAPDIDEIHNNQLRVNDIIDGIASEKLYPKSGTWKEKILFALKQFRRPVTAVEVAGYLENNEARFNPDYYINAPPGNIANVISVTMSKMGMENEISVDKSQFKNKYSLKGE